MKLIDSERVLTLATSLIRECRMYSSVYDAKVSGSWPPREVGDGNKVEWRKCWEWLKQEANKGDVIVVALP